ncbi:MAG TPA: BamA/TamA family outer membrane protein [Ramlibacter sp.]|nr:BamA/TamA family outer membrane protein [Ramlibacter sp.]
MLCLRCFLGPAAMAWSVLARRCLVALTFLALNVAQAQAPDKPSFDLDVRAPNPIRDLLARNLELRRYREVSDLDETELERLLALADRDARKLLGAQGYFNPKLELRVDRTTQPPRVVVTVEPGVATQVSAANIEFAGPIGAMDDAGAISQREAIRSGWRLAPGERFTQAAWDAAKGQALLQLTGRRYLRGVVAASAADIDAATGQASLGLKLDSGPMFRLGPLQFSGLERYDPRLVPRLARLPEGSEYDQDKLVQAQLRLAGSGYFDSAFLYVDPASDPQAAPVQVSLREARLQRVVLGLGLTTDSGPRLSIEHRHNRVPGIGWRADTRMQIERKSPLIETEWTSIPDEDGWRWGALARAERVRDASQDTHAQRLRAGRSYSGEHIDRNLYVQYDVANVRDATGALPAEDTGDGASIAANFVWTGRYFDQRTSPTSGSAYGFELGAGLTLTGSRSPFQRGVARWLTLRPLTVGRLQVRAEAGAVLARSTARVPWTQLFRTGGDTTVRGYGLREIGVLRDNGAVTPGRFMTVGSVEWQRPLRISERLQNLEHTVFLDAGAVADSPTALRPSVGVGTGVRYGTPIGPLQADIAYGFKTRSFRLHLTVGVTF